MLRMTIITTQPILEGVEQLGTFTVPPGSEGIWNQNPIRLVQLTYHIDACPRGSFLVMVNMMVGTDLVSDEKALCRAVEVLLGFDIAKLQEYNASLPPTENGVFQNFPSKS